MNRIVRALMISAAASGAAAALWHLLSTRAEKRGGLLLRRVAPADYIDELTGEEQRQLLDELGEQL